MKKSDTITELAKALIKAQSELKGAKRTQVNPYFKSHYADLAEIWDTCREPLNKNGLAICQTIDTEGEKTYLETVLLHESGEWISGRLPLLLTKLDAQGQGSAITYARRYSISAIVGVSEIDDDAEAAIAHPEKKTKAAVTPLVEELKKQGAIEKETTHPDSTPQFKNAGDFLTKAIKQFPKLKVKRDIEEILGSNIEKVTDLEGAWVSLQNAMDTKA